MVRLRWKNKKNARQGSKLSTVAGIPLVFIFFSWLLHIVSLLILPQVTGIIANKKKPETKRETVKFSVKTNSKHEKQDKRILETIQEKTLAKPDPKKARLGYNNHKTNKETKTRAKNLKKALDPGKQAKRNHLKASKNKTASQIPKQTAKTELQKLLSHSGKVKLPSNSPKNQRLAYEKLLQTSNNILNENVKEGYQDYIKDDLSIGDAIDLNTQEYRYIGYFTNLRKSIELTWNYPRLAIRQGMYGNVFLKFTIDKSGSVTKIFVIDSSGHKVLDSAIVEAIQLASPFAPLPESFGRKIEIKGDFNYVLH